MKSWFKKQMAVLLTLVLAFSVTIPVSAEDTDESVQTVTVTLSGQADGTFLFAPGEYEIPSNEAEKFGYKDSAGGVTTLDALVYAHELALGKAFTKDDAATYLLVTDSGWIQTAFGGLCSMPGFKVNDILPYDSESDYNESYGYSGLLINQAIIHDGDDVDFFSYSSTYNDLCTWFEQDGEKITNLKLEERQSQSIQLKGYSYMTYGSMKEQDIQANTIAIKNAQLTLTKIGAMDSTPIQDGVTDNNGNVVLSGLETGEYYLSANVATDNGGTPIIMPLCKLQVIPNIKDNIAATYTEANDAWTILEMVQAGKKDQLTKINEYVYSAAETINTSEYATEVEKSIIALNALGYDVKNLNVNGLQVNAIERLLAKDMSSSSPAMFGLIAIDAGKFELPEGECTRESLVKNLLSLQTTDYGWTYISLSENPKANIDMTGMALAAFAPYYLAKDAETAGLTEETYTAVHTAVENAINTLSEKQGKDGSYGNTDTDAWVIVGLSSIGIDADTDSRFIKNNCSLYDGMLKYELEDYSGFGWTDNKELNSYATNDAFRALVAYSNMKETGKPYNIYASDSSSATSKVLTNGRIVTAGDSFTLDTSMLSESKKLTYTTSDSAVAEVTKEGVVTAKKKGTVLVVADSATDPAEKLVVRVTIEDKQKEPDPQPTPTPGDKKDDTTEPTTEATTEAPAKVNYSKIPLQTGKKTNVIQINGGKTKIKKAKVNNKKIVSVTVKNGKLQIKAKKKGKAVITITDENGKVSKVTVEVKKSVPLKKLSLNKKKVTLKVNQKEKLVVTKNPVTAVTKLKWSTSDKKIATVDQNGKVKAKKKGKVTITVKASNGKKARCKVTVK